tara:strand:- start:246 stop:497 length:252 start_codon:yes stop_codon:yes gene_type:complete
MRKKFFKNYSFFLILSIIFPSAANAYAGPGVALGALIIFITVIFAFFASTLITFLKFSKKFYFNLRKLFSKNKLKRVNRKRRN